MSLKPEMKFLESILIKGNFCPFQDPVHLPRATLALHCSYIFFLYGIEMSQGSSEKLFLIWGSGGPIST